MNEVNDTTIVSNAKHVWLESQASSSTENFQSGIGLSLSSEEHVSKTFSAQNSINPIVTAAMPLLSLASKLYNSENYDDIAKLHANLTHEIKAFETQSKNFGVRSENILAARFVLCALFDEIILNTAWGNETSWGNYKLLPSFQHESDADEKFFTILNRLSADAAIYIDILELMYLSLNIGYCGKYRFLDNGLQYRSVLMDKLYHTIRMQRGEFSKNLSLPPSAIVKKLTTPIRRFKPWKTLIITTLLLVGISVGFHYLVNINATTINQNLDQLIQPLHQQTRNSS